MRIRSLIAAAGRQIFWPFSVFDRHEDGKVRYFNNKPIHNVPLSVIVKLISLLLSIAGILFTGDQIDVALIEKLLMAIFGEE